MARVLQHFITWRGPKKGRQTEGYRWFRIWIGLGLVLAILLLVNSISTYVLVSRRLIVDHLRSNLASQVAMLDQQFHREIRSGVVPAADQLAATLRQIQERSNGRIAWIQIQNGDGATVTNTGSPATPSFSKQYVREHISMRQPMFKTLNTAAGMVLVEVFPFRLPGVAGRTQHQLGTVEMGAWLEGDSATLWPLRRNLTINSSAALVLLISLIVIAVRLRSYVAGRQLEQEVEIARSVQRDLLPSANRRSDGFALAADCVPATRVSGDFFDTFSGRGNRAAFVLGDVSGKGVPAALLMGVIHGAVRSSCWTESPLHHTEATQQLNRLLYERAATERFATMFWSYFDSESQHLKYINAGHCPPLLLKAAHRNTILRLSIGGPVLGVLPDAGYQTGSVRMEEGDILVLYSDGIVEAANSEDEEFGEQRVQDIVRTCRKRTAEEIRDQILSSVEAFTGRIVPEDDRTLCVIVYSGTAKGTGSRESKTAREFASCAA